MRGSEERTYEDYNDQRLYTCGVQHLTSYISADSQSIKSQALDMKVKVVAFVHFNPKSQCSNIPLSLTWLLIELTTSVPYVQSCAATKSVDLIGSLSSLKLAITEKFVRIDSWVD